MIFLPILLEHSGARSYQGDSTLSIHATCQNKKRENAIDKWVKPRYCYGFGAADRKGAFIHDVPKQFSTLDPSPLIQQHLYYVVQINKVQG